MSGNPEISVLCLFTMDSRTPISLITVDGKQFVVFSTEIAVLAEDFPSMLALTNAKPVMLKATSSP